MKNASPRTTTRRSPTEGASAAAAGAIELREDRLVIRLPDFRLLRLVARSVLLTAAILTFPLLRAVIHSAGMPQSPPPAAAAAAARSRWVDDPFYLPMLLRDLQRQGLLGTGARAVFLGDPGSRLPFLKQNQIEPVSSDGEWIIPDHSVDFVLAAADFSDASFEFIDRVLKVGGITAVRLSSDPSHSFHLPPNYRTVYIRRFGSTIVAIKKIAHASSDDDRNAANLKASGVGRKLLAISKAKEAALNELEGVLLEPPSKYEESKKLWRRTKYLPDLMGDSLAEYPRRVFVDVGRTGSEKWFLEEYPKGDSPFEMIRLEAVGRGKEAVGISEWLARNVKEEEYVVMKAEAEVVEEMVNGRTIGLVDELFLECQNQWQNGKRSRRTYWECLALYGRLWDEGVAVHQWWG
ncbi:uncharacterized protein [Elaeis guineensis]|uniref:Uncharacterized protein LOC105058495 n=1 Tax=Elaeis guineensis var. tenera TaxID=51953 RepID=A0A6I9S9R9_ELAGV|nr:uncharacterized protein LOC105058495 [Elaeis guineensis]